MNISPFMCCSLEFQDKFHVLRQQSSFVSFSFLFLRQRLLSHLLIIPLLDSFLYLNEASSHFNFLLLLFSQSVTFRRLSQILNFVTHNIFNTAHSSSSLFPYRSGRLLDKFHKISHIVLSLQPSLYKLIKEKHT